MQLFRKIRQTYLKDDRIKRLVNEEKDFPILESYINLAIVENKEQQEKEKKLKEHGQSSNSKQYRDEILSTYEEIHGIKTSIDVKEIFQKCKDRTIRKILVLGRAGIGKSTFCQYVTYRWAVGEIWLVYKIVVLIRLRKLTESHYPKGPEGKEYLFVDLLKKEYYPPDDLSDGLSDEQIQHFKELCNKRQVLWILDGYDEFSQNIPKQLEGVFKNLCETQHHILTSRPHVIKLSYDVKLEIIGFTNENIPKYIDQFFYQVKDVLQDHSSKSQELFNFIRSNSNIWGIAHIPVNLELICSLWGDTVSSNTVALTMTELYDNIIEWLCRRHFTKKDEQDDSYDRELQFLECLAFEAMKRNINILPPTLLKRIGKKIDYPLSDKSKLFSMGILKSYDDRLTGIGILTEKEHYFLHLTFQEYFAARHLLKILQKNENLKAIKFINNNKYNQRFHFVFVFASGLLLKSDYQSYFKSFWSHMAEKPLDLVGLQHIKLTIACIDEFIRCESFPKIIKAHIKRISNWIKVCALHTSQDIRERSFINSLNSTQFLINTTLIQDSLVELLNTHERVKKVRILDFIGQLSNAAPSNTLLSKILLQVQDNDLYVQETALKTLGKIGEKAATKDVIDVLSKIMRDKDKNRPWREALYALGNMGEKVPMNEVINGLLNELCTGWHDSSTEAAVETLVMMGEKSARKQVVDALLKVLKDEDPHGMVSQAIFNALRNIGRRAATTAVIDVLLGVLQGQDAALRQRQRAIGILGVMGEKAAKNEVIDVLLKLVEDRDKRLCKQALYALGEMGEAVATPKVMGVVFNAAKDANSNVHYAALRVLGKLGKITETNKVIDVLLNELQHRNGEFSRAALYALMDMGEIAAIDKVIDALLVVLRDRNVTLWDAALYVLREMGERVAKDDIIGAVLKAMKNEDSQIRWGAVEALGSMGKQAAMSNVICALVDAVKDSQTGVRWAAMETLGGMGEKAAEENVINALLNVFGDQDKRLYREALSALGEMGEKAATPDVIDAIFKAIGDEEEMVRRAALYALGSMGEKAATQGIVERLLHTIFERKLDFGMGVGRGLLEVLINYKDMQQLQPKMIERILCLIRDAGYFYLGGLSTERLMKLYCDTGCENWLPFIFHVALIEGVAITNIGDINIRAFGVKGLSKIEVYMSKKLLMNLVTRFEMEQQKLIEGSSATERIDAH